MTLSPHIIDKVFHFVYVIHDNSIQSTQTEVKQTNQKVKVD